ncbi:hypothetical protein [uncultured Parabacteroides sp.]|uniref:hypothetical protein n=1 Tax=uncultured Parabacteroides sp. TaxID=512312 RepID=UPI0026129868|nr:hypothetical protein [uncultured Parabacteroides sp.]
MKTGLSIFLLFAVVIVSTASAQIISRSDYESSYFDREDYISENGDTTVYLYEKGNRFKPEQIHPGQVVPGLKKMSKEALQFF